MTDVSRFGATKEKHKAICCVQKLQNTVFIQKQTKRSEKPFTIGFYIILRLCYPQSQIIVCRYILTENPKNKFLSCYCNFLYNNFIIAWWVLRKKVDWKKQGKKTIILPSVIQHYKIFFHPNLKIWPLDKTLCVSVSVAYLPKACINNYYHGVSVFWKFR